MQSYHSAEQVYGYDDLLDDDEVTAVSRLILGSAAVGLCGAAFTVGVWLAVPSARTPHLVGVLNLALSDAVVAVGFLLTRGEPVRRSGPHLCVAQAWLLNFGSLASVGWTTVVAWGLARVLNDGRALPPWPVALGLGYVLPFALSCVPLSFGLFGESSGAFCWCGSIVVRRRLAPASFGATHRHTPPLLRRRLLSRIDRRCRRAHHLVGTARRDTDLRRAQHTTRAQ